MKRFTRSTRRAGQRRFFLVLIFGMCCTCLYWRWSVPKFSPAIESSWERFKPAHSTQPAEESTKEKVIISLPRRSRTTVAPKTSLVVEPVKKARSFTIDYERNIFLKDGEPFRFIAGAIHYFRVPKPYWEDRLTKMKAAGLNAIETYVEWSGHEPEPGNYNFADMYDIETFIKAAHSLDLLVILRPGPYICAERDNGGLPYWLLQSNSGRTLRSSHKSYTDAVDKWFDVLLPLVVPLLYSNGGPIAMVQVENEYGSFPACDSAYMKHLVGVLKDHLGPHVPLFTTDGASKHLLKCGTVSGALATVDFGHDHDVESALRQARAANRGKGPFVVSEFYSGWLDHWGEEHVHTNDGRIVKTLEHILKRNGSVTFYMFHGGTNFGFSNGANPPAQPTSYDYGAPLSEAGDPRGLYFDIMNVISRYNTRRLVAPDLPFPAPKLNYGSVEITCGPSLTSVMDHFRKLDMLNSATAINPMGFEAMGQNYGYVIYTTVVPFAVGRPSRLIIPEFSDRAYIIYGSSTVIVDSVNNLPAMISVSKGDTLTIIVENAGRINFGERLGELKGILSNVTLDDQLLTHWLMEAVPITKDSQITELFKFVNNPERKWVQSCRAPGFFIGRFSLQEGQEPVDTFLDPTGWTKGVAFVNGFNLGRYWPGVGPQVTLYIPGYLLRRHPNENHILLLEMEAVVGTSMSVKLTDVHKIDAKNFRMKRRRRLHVL
ncbi:beta-galactosidase-like [Ornithodoros turicata]|uniref:beta-galactosidase-like n=1 Tax=Ornithodoros turicata TaxID=34597 RepID=UPI003138DF09